MSWLAVFQGRAAGCREGVDLSGTDLARLCIEETRLQPLGTLATPHYSAFDLFTALDDTAAAVDNLYRTLMGEKIPPDAIRDAWKKSHRVDYSSFPRQIHLTDIGDFARVLSESIPNAAVVQAAVAARAAVEKAVIGRVDARLLQDSMMSATVACLPPTNRWTPTRIRAV